MSRAIGSASELTHEYVRGQTITTGSLKRGIWKISWPLVLVTSCLAIIDLVHVQYAGMIVTPDNGSAGSQAIIGVCDQILALPIIVLTSLATSTSAVISRAAGKGEQTDLCSAAAQAIRLCTVSGVVLSLIVFLGGKHILAPFSGCVDDCAQVIANGTTYLSISSFVLIPFAFVAAVNACFMGTGRSAAQLLTIVLMTGLDIAGNYLLFVKGYPIKDPGIQGIAMVSIAAYSLAAAGSMVLLCCSNLKGSLSKIFSNDNSIAKGIATAGLPPALQEIAWSAGTFVLYFIIALTADSTNALAGFNIGQRLETFAYVPLTALASAIVVIAGQNLGANRNKRAHRSSIMCAAVGSALMLVAGLLLYIFAAPLAVSANAAASCTPFVVDYLKVASFGLVFVALESIFSGTLQALEDTKVLLVVGFIANWVFSLPLAWLLATNPSWGSHGIWVALLVSNVLSGVAIFWRFTNRPQWRMSVARSVQSEESATEDSDVSRGRPCQELNRPPLDELRNLAEQDP